MKVLISQHCINIEEVSIRCKLLTTIILIIQRNNYYNILGGPCAYL